MGRGMVDDFLFNGIGIRRIIADDTLEMKKTVRVNVREFDRDGVLITASDFSIDLYIQITARSGQQDSDLAGRAPVKDRVDGQKATSDAEIFNHFCGIQDISHTHFRFYLERNPSETAFFLNHG